MLQLMLAQLFAQGTSMAQEFNLIPLLLHYVKNLTQNFRVPLVLFLG